MQWCRIALNKRITPNAPCLQREGMESGGASPRWSRMASTHLRACGRGGYGWDDHIKGVRSWHWFVRVSFVTSVNAEGLVEMVTWKGWDHHGTVSDCTRVSFATSIILSALQPDQFSSRKSCALLRRVWPDTTPFLAHTQPGPLWPKEKGPPNLKQTNQLIWFCFLRIELSDQLRSDCYLVLLMHPPGILARRTSVWHATGTTWSTLELNMVGTMCSSIS